MDFSKPYRTITEAHIGTPSAFASGRVQNEIEVGAIRGLND